jgi:hypothetical protein
MHLLYAPRRSAALGTTCSLSVLSWQSISGSGADIMPIKAGHGQGNHALLTFAARPSAAASARSSIRGP